MKTRPTNLEDGTPPQARVELFRDRDGNWFACVERQEDRGMSVACTGTYTSPREAWEAAWALAALK
jgi:hypothetical protein